MNFKSLSLLYFVFVGQSLRVFPRLYMCTFDQHLVNIDLACPDDTKIHIVDIWFMKSSEIYKCGNHESAPVEQKHSPTTEMRHKILTKCLYQRYCKVGIFPDSYLSDGRSVPKRRGIGISYECVPVVKFRQICNSTLDKNLSEIYLIDKTDENTYNEKCHCTVNYTGNSGQFSVTLTHFPTHRVFLKIKTRRKSGPQEELYKNQVFKNETVHINAETVSQEFILTKNAEFGKHIHGKHTTELLLVRIAATGEHFTLRCVRPVVPGYRLFLTEETPPEEVSPVENYVFTSVGTVAVCILSVGVCLFIYRWIKRKKDASSSSQADTTPPNMISTVPRNASSIYVDCSERLHSYAEIGSIFSDYRHYAMPDDVSQKSLKAKIQYKTLVEDSCSHEDNVGRTSPGVILKIKGSRKEKGIKEDGANTNSIEKDSDKTHAKYADKKDDRCSGDQNTSGKRFASSRESPGGKTEDKNQSCQATSGKKIKKEMMNMIPNERYDPSGYLDLDVPEEASNASLMTWKKEIYTVEHMAKLSGETEDLNEISKRKVKIVQKLLRDKPLGNRYIYACDREIIFTEDESESKRVDK